MESRYGTSADYASSRGVHCMEYLDGRIYIGGGNWDDNTGPVPLISILPGATPSWTNEYSAGAEHIESFKKFSDGRIWTRATDPKEGNPNYGYFFAKYPGGEWVRCPLGKIDWNPAHQLNGAELYTHEWDFCDYKGKFYFTGFGIGGSQYWLNGDETFANKMGSVTTGQTNGYYRYSRITEMKGKKVTTEEGLDRERFMTLMPFTNGCAAVTYHWYESRKPEVNQCYFWRRNESTGLFAREDCSWDAFLNGYDNVDRELAGSTYGWWIYFRKATPFNGRVYYIVTPGCSMNLPIGFFSAAMDGSGNITSQRHAFDGGHGHVIDIAVVGGAMYVMTVKYVSASSIVHGIWKTTDGQNFTQLATFTSDQYFESFTYAKGCFYLGYGAAQIGNWGISVASPSTEKAGQIWRFAMPQSDDDGSNDGRDFSNAPWYWDELGVRQAFLRGITGKGVKVGVVDTGCQPITEGDVKHMVIEHQGGATGNVGEHGIGVCSIIKSDRFGIAPDCELHAYNGSDFVDDINGLWWCFTNGCKVVNFSGGYTPFDYTTEQLAWAKEQIRQMLDQGLILVAAGGNAPNETLSFPQDMEGVINIAGIKQDCTSAGLNDNWSKDFAAFGNNVPLYTSMTGSTGTNGGSSFAAPMATAICALYLQQNPDLTRDELYGILKSTCQKLSEGRSRVWGWGLLQAGSIPSDYKKQSAINTEKAAWVKATKLTLGNNGLGWDEASERYTVKMYAGQSLNLKCSIVPANASDTNTYWYCGNADFNRIDTDNVLTIPQSLPTGRFLVYMCLNAEREVIGRIRVDVVDQGQETQFAEDPPPSDPQTPTDPDPVDPPAISVHETEYLWSPAGGSGNWSEAANWRVAGSVAAECPSATDSVVFGSSDSEVVLSANCTISNLTISSVGKHVFRTTDVTQKYTLTCATSVSLSGAGGGTLVVEDIDMSGRKIDDLAGLKQLVITGKGKVYPSASPTTDIVLVNGGTLYNGGSDLEFKKLKLVGGPSVICFSQYTNKGVVFDSFEAMNGSGVPVVSVKDGRVSFTNTAGIETVGGTSTLASGASTIPVCPNFQIGSGSWNDRQHGRSACTIDNGVIKEIPAASMKDTLDGATELDNVHLGADYTLDHDVTVNALIFNNAKINLGGHVVTVRSGVFREGTNGMFNNVISNGIVRLCRPNALGDATNNTDVRCRVDFFTDDNTDSEKCMVAYNCEGGGWDTYAVYTNFTGTFAVPPSTAFGFKSEMRSPRAVVEMRGGAIRPSAHYVRANLGGISGTGSANYSNWRTLLWLGEIAVGDQDDFNTLEGRIVVANGGFIKPGYVDYDGGRRGRFSVHYSAPQGQYPRLDTLEFRNGAKLKVTLRADGTCSWLDASQTQKAGTFLDVTLAGDLVLEEAGRVKSGNGPWIVLKTGKETTGSFANAGANGRGIKGYKVAYNVDLGDGTYGVQVTKKQSGFSVVVR